MTQIDRSEGLVGNTAIKAPCRLATTANLASLAGLLTIDGSVTVAGDRVLVKDQTSGVDNGIYVVDTGAWDRAQDCDGSLDLVYGTLVKVNAGSANQGFWYVTTTTDPIVVGSTSIAFALASSTLAVVSAFMQTMLDDITATAARDTLNINTVALEDYGGVGDNATDNTAAIAAWFAAGLSTGKEMTVGPGTFYCASAIEFDFVSTALYGFTMTGAGVQKTIFRSGVSSGVAFSVITSGGTVPSPAIGVYAKISQIGFLSAHNGKTLMIGKADFSDQQNLVRLEVWSSNTSDGSSACLLEMNATYGCNIDMNGGLGTTANAGVGLRLKKAAFSDFFVSIGGTESGGTPTGTGVAIHMTNDFAYGNTFTAPDLEYFKTGVLIDYSAVTRNTFIGGTWGDFVESAVKSTAGSQNIFINPNLNTITAPFFLNGASAVGVGRPCEFVYAISTPSNGATLVLGPTARWEKLTTGTLATLTITLPQYAYDGQVKTIQTQGELTALTLNAAGGNTVFDAVTTMAAGTSVSYMYNASGTQWLRIA
tara:strand:- start:46628 stop:48238 length:1611 start_codon:yes stop_codon:yes gene_type:complete